jgi:hypothetical protein
VHGFAPLRARQLRPTRSELARMGPGSKIVGGWALTTGIETSRFPVQ